MRTARMRVVTIVAKSSLDSMLATRLGELGISEDSIVRSKASAPRPHLREGIVEGYTRTEVVVSENIGETILREARGGFLGDPSIICFVSDLPTHGLSGGLWLPKRSAAPPREEVWGDYLITI